MTINVSAYYDSEATSLRCDELMGREISLPALAALAVSHVHMRDRAEKTARNFLHFMGEV